MNAITATVLAKADALTELHPRLFAALLIASGVLLLIRPAMPGRERRHEGQGMPVADAS